MDCVNLDSKGSTPSVAKVAAPSTENLPISERLHTAVLSYVAPCKRLSSGNPFCIPTTGIDLLSPADTTSHAYLLHMRTISYTNNSWVPRHALARRDGSMMPVVVCNFGEYGVHSQCQSSKILGSCGGMSNYSASLDQTLSREHVGGNIFQVLGRIGLSSCNAKQHSHQRFFSVHLIYPCTRMRDPQWPTESR